MRRKQIPTIIDDIEETVRTREWKGTHEVEPSRGACSDLYGASWICRKTEDYE